MTLDKMWGGRGTYVRVLVRSPAPWPGFLRDQESLDLTLYLFTTLSVTCDGYCCEWCTALCATTAFTSS